jgi:hypothetical protein
MDQRAKSAAANAAPRLLFIDNLRWSMILLVISMHAADTYSPLGNWYFTDRTPLALPTLLVFAAWQMYLQSFFMGLLFFVAGFFVPASFDRKGPGRFLRDRAYRLGLPVVFYMFVLGPVTEYYAAHSWNSTKPTSMAHEWIKHIRNGQFLQENGPLWFCLALLIFCFAYAAIRSLRPKAEAARARAIKPGPLKQTAIFGFVLLLGASTFLVRALRAPTILNMHLGDFPQYILLFCAGIFAARRGFLWSLNHKASMRWLLTLPVSFAVWLGIVVGGGGLRPDGRVNFAGWHWQAAAICFWEAFACVAISLILLVLFRDRFGSQGSLAKFLSANAFSVYVFHPPIVIMGARLLRVVAWDPLAKFVVLWAAAAAVTFALSAAVFRRMPLLRAIL